MRTLGNDVTNTGSALLSDWWSPFICHSQPRHPRHQPSPRKITHRASVSTWLPNTTQRPHVVGGTVSPYCSNSVLPHRIQRYGGLVMWSLHHPHIRHSQRSTSPWTARLFLPRCHLLLPVMSKTGIQLCFLLPGCVRPVCGLAWGSTPLYPFHYLYTF